MVRREILVDSLVQRLIAGPAFRSLAIGLALVSTASAQQPSETQHYAPPVHVQPAAFSVIESPTPTTRQVGFEAPAAHSPAPISHGAEIANMSQFMRMQNEAALAAKDAQVNAARHQLQRTRAIAAQAEAFPRSTPRQAAPRRQYAYPAPRPPRVAAAPAQVAPPRAPAPVARVQAQRQSKAPAPRAPRQVRVASQSIKIQRAPATQRRAVGLQDRISHAFRKTFTREQQPVAAPPKAAAPQKVAAPVPTLAAPTQEQHVQLVQHTDQPIPVPQTEFSPTLAEVQPTVARSRPSQEYRSTNVSPDKVIVPFFVEPDLDGLEVQLTSKQEPIGSGVRRPRVESRSQPLSYGAEAPEISIFRNSSTQDDVSDDPDIGDRLKQMDDEFKSQRDRSDDELPLRPSEDRSLLDFEDKDTEAEALRRRKAIDAEIDELEDREEVLNDDLFGEEEDPDDIDDEEDDSPPVYDERGCGELRELLIGRSIRDISLDISPPASPRRYEIGSLSRSWSDASGNVIGTGTMVDIRRGYVILDSGIKLPYAKLSESDHSAIAENWLLPSGCSIGSRGEIGRHWAPQTVTWHASSLCHKPLYFENVQLERYGHSRGPLAQPIHSAFHFFGSLLFLPYNTALHPPNECRSALGYYRPGSCAPWLLDPIPFSREGIRRQALVATGAAFFP